MDTQRSHREILRIALTGLICLSLLQPTPERAEVAAVATFPLNPRWAPRRESSDTTAPKNSHLESLLIPVHRATSARRAHRHDSRFASRLPPPPILHRWRLRFGEGVGLRPIRWCARDVNAVRAPGSGGLRLRVSSALTDVRRRRADHRTSVVGNANPDGFFTSKTDRGQPPVVADGGLVHRVVIARNPLQSIWR